MVHASMQPRPLIACSRRPASSLCTRLRMLSSPTCSSSTKPNPTLHRTMKQTTALPSTSIPGVVLYSNANTPVFNPHDFAPRFTLSKCFSATSDSVAFPDASGLGGARMDDGDSNPRFPLVVVSFYKFAHFSDHANLRNPLKELCQERHISGGIILAPEGINGSICGARESVEEILHFIQIDARLKGLRRVESPVSLEEEAIHHGHMNNSPLAAGEDTPFRWDHVRVKLKEEIVSLGMPSVSPIEQVGKYISPSDWNALISDPDTVVIDVRNNYETRIGKFKGAVDPCTTAFQEFPAWVDNQFQVSESESEVDNDISSGSPEKHTEKEQKIPRVAMYCTGGIRCEKATSLLLSKGFKEVYHLEGGILKYLEEVPKTESLWEGECFVFDKRVSLEHGLIQGTYKLCYGCKLPVSEVDTEVPEWEYGISCPHCYSSKSAEEKERARARQRQFETWGIIGGPDKGRPPTRTTDAVQGNPIQMSNSV